MKPPISEGCLSISIVDHTIVVQVTATTTTTEIEYSLAQMIWIPRVKKWGWSKITVAAVNIVALVAQAWVDILAIKDKDKMKDTVVVRSLAVAFTGTVTFICIYDFYLELKKNSEINKERDGTNPKWWILFDIRTLVVSSAINTIVLNSISLSKALRAENSIPYNPVAVINLIIYVCTWLTSYGKSKLVKKMNDVSNDLMVCNESLKILSVTANKLRVSAQLHEAYVGEQLRNSQILFS